MKVSAVHLSVSQIVFGLIVFCFLSFVHVQAQQQQATLQWSNFRESHTKYDLEFVAFDKKTNYTFWLLREKSKTFLKTYDKNNNLITSKEIQFGSVKGMNSQHADVLKMLFSGDRFNTLSAWYDRQTKSYHLYLHQLSFDGNVLTQPVFVDAGIDRMAKYYALILSPDSTNIHLFINASRQTGADVNKIQLKTFDRSLNLQKNSAVMFTGWRDVEDRITMEQIYITQKGDIFLRGDRFDKTDKILGPELWMLNVDNNIAHKINIDLGENIMAHNTVCYRSDEDSIFVAGYYNLTDTTKRKKQSSIGVFHARVNTADLLLENVKMTPLDTLISPESRDIKNSDNTYSLKMKKQGGIILIFENTREHKDKLNFKNILVVDFNREGKVNYFKEVRKFQSYAPSLYQNTPLSAYSYFYMYNEATSNLHIIFNDHKDNLLLSDSLSGYTMGTAGKTIPVMVTINAKGQVNKEQLYARSKNTILLCPSCSEQITDTEASIAGVQKGGFKIGRLKLKKVTGKQNQNQLLKAKSTDRTFGLFMGSGFGVISNPTSAVLKWIDQPVQTSNFNKPVFVYDFSILFQKKAMVWGMELSFAGSKTTSKFHNRTTYDYVGLVIGRSAYIPAFNTHALITLSVGRCATSLVFHNAETLPFNTQNFKNVDLGQASLSIGPSVKFLKTFWSVRQRYGGVGGGIDLGMRINLLGSRWEYNEHLVENAKTFKAKGVPQITTFTFYTKVDLGILGVYNRYRKPFR